MKTDIQRKAEHILHLIKAAKDAGIKVYVQTPALMN